MNETRIIPFGRPWITDDDRAAVMEVLQGAILTHGPQGKAFESEFAAFLDGEAHCVSVSSCMAALHLAYVQLGIKGGDEVIVPAQTHSATVHAVEWVGATPVFADCDPATGNLTADRIVAAVTPRTRALSVVHFLGIPCDMPAIMSVAQKHGLKVVEDCAIALGARYDRTHVGLFGDAGCFSFYPVKHITTGEGGMFVSRHREVAAGVARLRALGVDRTHAERAIPGMYEVTEIGLNYRMSEMQAALGRSQLRRFSDNLGIRRANFTALQRALANVRGVRVIDATGPALLPDKARATGREKRAENSYYCLSMVLEGELAARRNEIVKRLNEAGIGTSIYYPQPVPRMQYYRTKYGYDRRKFVEAERISDHSIALPVGPHITEEDINYMVKCISTILGDIEQ
jgi:dTDP-4-amino-4,6-dideoxygalactose transaminase